MLTNNEDKIPRYLHFHCQTWSRDSHGLFDYENSQVKNDSWVAHDTCLLVRKKNEVIKFKSQNEVNPNEDRELCNVIKSEAGYFLQNRVETGLVINNQNLTDLQEKIWHVIKSNNMNNNNNQASQSEMFQSKFIYNLRQNDIIKLGRIKFLVRDMKIGGSSTESTKEVFRDFKDCGVIMNEESNICKICQTSSGDESNPIISICKCKGTMIIHLECLKLWLKHKLTIKEMTKKAGVSYTVKAYNCEICKEPYPISINYNNLSYKLLQYDLIDAQNYVILESINSIKENEYPLSIHILYFFENNDEFILGRGHDSDVRISDISVSRVHSKIIFKENKFFLEDCGSKFGTLVLSKDDLIIDENPKVIQIGRTLISASIQNTPQLKNDQKPSEMIKTDFNQPSMYRDPQDQPDFFNFDNFEKNK